MEKKFSKGNWFISDFGMFIENQNGVIAAVSLSKQEHINNAKLIAAAPDLLDALECIYNDKEVWSELSDKQKSMIEQAIKKATK